MPINFEKDLLKHYVRTHGWLAAAKDQKHAIRNRSKRIPLRYFTFCAAGAIDVFMFEREGILKRSEETDCLEDVYYCEENDENFALIAGLTGSPEKGFQGPFDEIVLFKDNEDTEGKTLLGDNPYSPELWEKLRYKDAHCRLRNAFPFDIINLDMFGIMFPSEQEIITPLLESITHILRWQTESKFSINNRECKQFTLFLTSHIDPDLTDKTAIEQLENRVIDNINSSVEFKSAFLKQYGHNEVKKLMNENFAEFFCVALTKYMVYKSLYDYGWQVTCGPTYLYNRDDKWKENKHYQIMHTVSVYERIPGFQRSLDTPSTSQYIQSVTQLVSDGVKWVDDVVKNPTVSRELGEDLKQIVELRDKRRDS